jgi:HlyD family secretion protein
MEKAAKSTLQQRKKRRWSIAATGLIILAGVLLLLIAANKSSSAASNQSSLNAVAIQRGDLVVRVTESGSIKARNPIDLKSEVEGRVTIISIVPEGTYVTQQNIDEGLVLCELDSGELDEDLVQRRISFANAEASYLQATEAYAIQLKENESDIAADRLQVKFALMDLQKYLGEDVANAIVARADEFEDPNVDIAVIANVENLLADINDLGGAASQAIGELQDNILLTQAKYKRADNQLTWTEKLYEKQYVSETELEGDQLDVQSLDIQVGHAETELDLYRRYDFSKQTQKFLSDYFEAKRKLERTYALARSREAQAKASLESAKLELELRKNRLEKTKKQMAAVQIRAPEPGLVVYGSSGDESRRFRGSGIIAPGETVYERQTIITLLPTTSEMMAEIAVHESSVDKVKPGQLATITIDAFPDRTFTGQVLKVAPLPDQQRGWLSPDVKVYKTEVSIEGKHDFLKPGMSTRVEILVDQLQDVLIAPVQVVANRGGKKVCYVVNGSGAQEREVQTGAFNDTHVEIIAGVTQGEQVLMNPPRITETTQESAERMLQAKAGGDAMAGAYSGDVAQTSSGSTGQPALQPALVAEGASDVQAAAVTSDDTSAPSRQRRQQGERANMDDDERASRRQAFENMTDKERARRFQEFQNMSEEERAARIREFRSRGGAGPQEEGGGGGRNRGGDQ